MPRTNQVLNSLLEEAVLISEELYVSKMISANCMVTPCRALAKSLLKSDRGEQGANRNNFLSISSNSTEVALSYEDGCPVEGNGVGRKVIDRVQETYSELNGKGFAYDGEKTLFTLGSLARNKLKFTVVLEDVTHSRLEEEVAKKKEEFHNDATIRKISEQCEADKIQFQVEVLQGNVPDVAINASIRLEATSVILDKRMKKYKKDFIESLYCTLLIMKRDNTMQQTKGSTAL
ncbi:hypothetical protein RJT34_15944 [Clitoria ternatea]|uniref:Protein argonaute N-terminal domain-containing protein n=1 Tax=Clitoria ternatea TaxID=43366 RepID=A0AAN9J8B6_CLITE